MRRGQYINISWNLEEVDFNHPGRLEGFNTSMKEVNADVEITRELEFEVESEDLTDFLQFHDKTLMNEVLFPINEQRK